MKKWLIFIGLCFVSLYAYSWGSGGSSSYSYETFKPSSATTVQIQYIGSIFKNDNKIYFTDEMNSDPHYTRVKIRQNRHIYCY